jgi:tetratricopeptide (TPR) repeat protein
MIMGEGYRRLAAFQFEEAKEYFREVQDNGGETEGEVDRAAKACEYWQPLLRHKELFDRYFTDNLYKRFRQYDFGPASGLQQFKQALLEHIAHEMIAAGRFYIDDHETVADLLLELNHTERAEEAVLQEVEKHPNDYQLFYYLAQIQWQSHQQGEAKKHWAQALLHDPRHVPFNRIEYEGLNALIHDVGAEMAPAFGWVRDVLPLVPLPEDVTIGSDAHRKAVDSYRLLCRADRAAVKGNRNDRIKYRKNLYHQAPELYKEYFEPFLELVCETIDF